MTAVQMGEALIRGFTRSGVSTWEQICASVKSKERQSALSAMGLRVYGNALNGGAADLAANSDIIFLGVSPGLGGCTVVGGMLLGSLCPWPRQLCCSDPEALRCVQYTAMCSAAGRQLA